MSVMATVTNSSALSPTRERRTVRLTLTELVDCAAWQTCAAGQSTNTQALGSARIRTPRAPVPGRSSYCGDSQVTRPRVAGIRISAALVRLCPPRGVLPTCFVCSAWPLLALGSRSKDESSGLCSAVVFTRPALTVAPLCFRVWSTPASVDGGGPVSLTSTRALSPVLESRGATAMVLAPPPPLPPRQPP